MADQKHKPSLKSGICHTCKACRDFYFWCDRSRESYYWSVLHKHCSSIQILHFSKSTKTTLHYQSCIQNLTQAKVYKYNQQNTHLGNSSKMYIWRFGMNYITELMQICHSTAEDVQGWAVCGVAVLAEPCLCFSFVTMLFPANSRVFWKCFINLRNRRTFSTHKGNITDIYSFIFSEIDGFYWTGRV